jgi:tRNA-uridine 2-sulfurtransferase
MRKGSKVFVALSGGVDAVVVAVLLQERCYDVTGVFIKIWQPEFVECTWKEDRLDALRVAVALDIPFKEIDLSEIYKSEVIDEMLDGYKSGITPNPDVLCNRYIKFGALWNWAKKHGADILATGHHARVKETEYGNFELMRGIDNNKDQSYFLWQLTGEDLAHILMPIGELTKREVRNLAIKYKLPVAKKPDSQGLCFVGHVDVHDFLKKFIKTKSGKVLSEDGANIGVHEGAELYTLGQRHGFKVNLKNIDSTPKFVSKINVKENTITVSDDVNYGAIKVVHLTKENWVNYSPKEIEKYFCQIRYRQRPLKCAVSFKEKKIEVNFDKEHVITPGQSLVIYKEEICLGGGIISSK